MLAHEPYILENDGVENVKQYEMGRLCQLIQQTSYCFPILY